MEFNNKVFSFSVENINMHFFIHHESFMQSGGEIREKNTHSHVYHELLYSLGDNNLLLWDGKEIPISKNTPIVIKPYVRHSTVYTNNKQLYSIGFFYDRNRNPKSEYDLFSQVNRLFSTRDITIGVPDEGIRHLLNQLQSFYKNMDTVTYGFILSTFIMILYSVIGVLQDMEDDGKQTPEGKTTASIYNLDLLYRIDARLCRGFTTDITPEQLSDEFYISARQINRYILKQYGQTFLQRRTELRLNAAEKLLRKTDKPIGSISQEVGYHSINTFYSAFKKRFGVTPEIYRKETKDFPSQ